MEKKLIVVKAGTTSLTGPSGDVDREKIANIVRQLADLRDAQIPAEFSVFIRLTAHGDDIRVNPGGGLPAAAAVSAG